MIETRPFRAAHIRVTESLFTSERTMRLDCDKCGARESLAASRLDSFDTGPARLQAFVAKHEHPLPKPLTVEERERIRILGIHRRGALRCGYGGSAR